MKTRALLGLPLAGLFLLHGGDAQYVSAKRKIEAIGADTLSPGSRVQLSEPELNSYVAREVVSVAPRGVRQTRVELAGGSASATALIDFNELQRARGNPPGWLMAKILEGERPVRVSATIESGGGRAVVNVRRVEISGVAIEGATLDYLIRNYLMQYYPEAKVGQPFQLGHRIDKLDVQPSAVTVVIGR